MILYKHITDIKQQLQLLKSKGKTIGFAPTMGALHAGHISLIKTAKQKCDVVVSSIFVNPTQFNDPKDYEKYPITIERDMDMLEKSGCDILFLPSVNEMYPEGVNTQIKIYKLGYLETVLDGAYRPGHFQGVCRVVEKLLNIVTADKLFLGQKDYQQCMVLTKLVSILQKDIHVIICPTLREANGLAMSSRNVRLSTDASKKAPLIYQTLSFIKDNIKQGYVNDLKQHCKNYLTDEGYKVDYIEIANAETLELLEQWDGKTKLVALAAAFIGDVRLIDNLIL